MNTSFGKNIALLECFIYNERISQDTRKDGKRMAYVSIYKEIVDFYMGWVNRKNYCIDKNVSRKNRQAGGIFPVAALI